MPETATLPDYQRRWDRRVEDLQAEVFRERSRLSVSEWAERHRILTKGPMAGQLWTNEEAPYLVEIMDTISDPNRPRRACVIKSSRVGYTEGVMGNSIGYFIDQVPTDVIVMQPSDDEADDYSIEHLDPLFHETPCLRERLHLDSYKDSRNKIAYKKFSGGSLVLIGPKPSALRRRSARVAFSDEIDELADFYEQGDPLLRLDKRLDDFDDSIHVRGSTPTNEGSSRITKEWKTSDQRRYHVPCPHCGESQPLEWGGKDEPHGIKWDKEVFCQSCGAESESGDECSECGAADLDVRHLPETAHYVCRQGCRIVEAEKRDMVQLESGAGWVATNPKGRYPGWHIHALMSLFAGARWPKLVQEWLDAQGDPEALKVFVNTVLGEAWDEQDQKKVDLSKLEDRAEAWVDADNERIEVPDGVGVLTAGVDVQGSWLEVLIRGYGAKWESWDVLHQRIPGDPERTTVWAALDGLLARRYRHASGAELPVLATLIDSGYKPDAVYDFTGPRESRNVWASKGDKGQEGAPPLKGPSRANASKVPVFTIGTFTMKESLFSRLAIQRPGPRYIHFRAMDPEWCNGFDAEYFAQFGAEKKVPRRIKGTLRWKKLYVKKRERNEAIDLHGMADGALRALGPGIYDDLGSWARAARENKLPTSKRHRRRGRVRSKGIE